MGTREQAKRLGHAIWSWPGALGALFAGTPIAKLLAAQFFTPWRALEVGGVLQTMYQVGAFLWALLDNTASLTLSFLVGSSLMAWAFYRTPQAAPAGDTGAAAAGRGRDKEQSPDDASEAGGAGEPSPKAPKEPFSVLEGVIPNRERVEVQFVADSDEDVVSDFAWHVKDFNIWRDQISEPRWARIKEEPRFQQDWPDGRAIGIGVRRTEVVLQWQPQNRAFIRTGQPPSYRYREPGSYKVDIELRADGKIRLWVLHFDFDPNTGFSPPTKGSRDWLKGL